MKNKKCLFCGQRHKIKLCPECGSKGVVCYSNGFYVRCSNEKCRHIGKSFDTEKQALEDWNKEK